MRSHHNKQGGQCRGVTTCAGILFLDASICPQFIPSSTSLSVQTPILCSRGIKRPLSSFFLRFPIHSKPQNASNTRWLGTIPQLHWILSASARNEPDCTQEWLLDVYLCHTLQPSCLWPSKRPSKAERQIRGRLCESKNFKSHQQRSQARAKPLDCLASRVSSQRNNNKRFPLTGSWSAKQPETRRKNGMRVLVSPQQKLKNAATLQNEEDEKNHSAWCALVRSVEQYLNY